MPPLPDNIIPVYYCLLGSLTEPVSDEMLADFPALIRDEIRKYKKNDDQARLYAGKYLLAFLIKNLGFPENTIEKYHIDSMGRPYIDNFPDFNITHSGQVVAVAFSQRNRIGIDVEMIRPIDAPAFTKQFSAREIAEITGSADVLDTFFTYWTQKESVMKADGRGMRIPLHDISLHETYALIAGNHEKWWLYPFDIHPGYKAHVCSPREGLALDIQKVEVPLKSF